MNSRSSRPVCLLRLLMQRRLGMWKKTSFKTGSVRGDRDAERMHSVVMTCRKQARSFFCTVADVAVVGRATLLSRG